MLRSCPTQALKKRDNLPIVVVEPDAAVEQFLTTSGNENFGSHLIGPSVQKGQLACKMSCAIAGDVVNLAAEGGHRRTARRVSRAVAMKDMNSRNVRAWRERILVDPETHGVRKVRAVTRQPRSLSMFSYELTSIAQQVGRCLHCSYCLQLGWQSLEGCSQRKRPHCQMGLGWSEPGKVLLQ